jgi:hypothetical protein
MKNLFERLKTEGYVVIREIVLSKAQENVGLEFKVKSNKANGELSREDRGTLGIALSAFANSSGGLLIWGIEATKGADGVDAAQTEHVIPNLALFKSAVSRAVGELLMPRHDGILVEAIEHPKKKESGFLAIWVDRSERRPHRSEAKDDKRYYKRAGDSSFIMEHYDIEDAFNRVALVDLDLVFGLPTRSEAESVDVLSVRYRCSLDFSLENRSALSGCAPYVSIDRTVAVAVIPLPSPILSRVQFGTRPLFQGDASIFVHPGLNVPVFRAAFNLVHHRGLNRWFLNDTALEHAQLALDCGVGCQNARAKQIAFEWSGDALRKLLRFE